MARSPLMSRLQAMAAWEQRGQTGLTRRDFLKVAGVAAVSIP